jgi:hypothetical protein
MSAISSKQPCLPSQNLPELKTKQSSVLSNPLVKTVAAIALYIFALASIIFGICLTFTTTPIISLASAAAIGMKWPLIAGIITTITGVFTLALSYKIFNEAKADNVSNETKKPASQHKEPVSCTSKKAKTAASDEDSDGEKIELTPEIVLEEAREKYSARKYGGNPDYHLKIVQEKLDDGILNNPRKYMKTWGEESTPRRHSVKGFFKNLFVEMGIVEFSKTK